MNDDREPPAKPAEASPAPPAQEGFAVGIGASAGGLEAITELLKQLPANVGIPIIVVQHLERGHESLLVELLRRVTPLPVEWAGEGVALAANRIYVARPKTLVRIKEGAFALTEDMRTGGGAINHLLCSLAAEWGERAIGVILSGTGSDGVHGLKSIKAAGGIVFAQSTDTASFSAMPRAAIDAGCVDRVLPPAEIAEELARLTQTTRALWEQFDGREKPGTEIEQLATVFRLLAVRTGVDFRDYKPTTIRRRLVRRMVLAKTPALGEYLKLLHTSREEVELLYESLLINVTEFFRDPDSFAFLKSDVLPALLRQHLGDRSPVRIWVPGCATGEEAYSLSILMSELRQELKIDLPVQIFGTDVSERAIATARAGYYSPAEVANVTPERLARFFYQTERGYVVQKLVRDQCVFARQNLIKDPPFSRLDLISCRNVMIYLGAALQRRLMPIFHYALNPQGFLVLGTSESVGVHQDLYRMVDRRFRIYSRKSAFRRRPVDFAVEPSVAGLLSAPKPPTAMTEETKEPFDIIQEADRIVLGRHGPTGVLVNRELEIVQFRGDVSPYLAPAEGRASLNLLKMAREGLTTELQAAVVEAGEKNERIRRTGVSVMHESAVNQIELDVTPIPAEGTKGGYFLILFNPITAPAAPSGSGPVAKSKALKSAYLAQIEQLRQDLHATRGFLQTTIEKHEATNHELRAANEEVQSSNEELQSTNEELETAKEELQSTNEELTTVNEELHTRHIELLQLNNDLHNLINSVHLPIIILGRDLKIRRFTPMAEKLLNVIPTDIGRPLSDININLQINDLPKMIHEVIDSLTQKEIEVQDQKGLWYSMRLRPYKTTDNKIDGVVLTLIDIDQMKRMVSVAQEARDFAHAVIESTGHPMVALDGELVVRLVNDSFCRLFTTSRERIIGRPFLDSLNHPETHEGLGKILTGILPSHGSLTRHRVQFDLPGAGPTQLEINVHPISSGERSYPLILLSVVSPS